MKIGSRVQGFDGDFNMTFRISSVVTSVKCSREGKI